MLAALRSRRRHRTQKGAVAIEAALITPVFILVLFGIIEFGMLFKDWLAVSSSVRAGARLASAEPRVTTFAQDAADNVAMEGNALQMTNVKQLWVYKADTDGYPTGVGSFSDCTVCVKFTWNTSSNAFEPSYSNWESTSQNACQGTQDAIGVYMEIEHDSVTKFIFDSFDITEHTVMSLEPIPVAQVCKS
ncbi:MAG: pilus assembly protein [Nocardioidaceae bacterium]